jgi:hypothetical protein
MSDTMFKSPYDSGVSPWGTFHFKHKNKMITITDSYNSYARYANPKLWDWLTDVKYNSPLDSYIVFGMEDIKGFEKFSSQTLYVPLS